MIETITVKAAKGMKCPMEGAPRKYITDAEAVTVRKTVYYQRLLKDGSLIAAPKEATAPVPQKEMAAKADDKPAQEATTK
jgi:hypothetical protein